MKPDRWRLVTYLLAALVVVPVLASALPPAADLPQHVAQATLFDAWRAGDPAYALRGFGPNNLCYLPILLFRPWFSAWATGRIVVALLLLAWAWGMAHLARVRGRAPEAALLATLPAFCAAMAWGFLNFLVGVPVFCAWLATFSGDATPARRALTRGRALGLTGLALLLYAAHALWFAMAGLIALALTLRAVRTVDAERPRDAMLRLLTFVPTGILALVWYPQMVAARAAAGFSVAPVQGSLPWQRLLPSALVDEVFGMTRGPAEGALLAGTLLWVAVGIATRSRAGEDDAPRADVPLLIAGSVMLVAGLLLPQKAVNTILFAQRWVPVAAALMVLGAPAPRVTSLLPRAGVVALLLAQVASTSLAWRAWATLELDGLREALDALGSLPRPATADRSWPRVLGLDHAPESRFIEGRPFLQAFAWAQAERGGTLNFSFAEHDSTLVTFAGPQERPFSPGLEWLPERARARDLRAADALVVHGDDSVHAALSARPEVVAVTSSGAWRLYTRRP